MLERIVAQIALALFAWLEKRIERGSVAVDPDGDDGRISRAGSRLREWLRSRGVDPRERSDASGSVVQGQGLHPDRERVEADSKRS